MLDPKLRLPHSHRHLSNIMALFPFNLITRDGDQTERQRIKASLAQYDKVGTGAWVGYSFSWMSCLRARVGDADRRRCPLLRGLGPAVCQRQLGSEQIALARGVKPCLESCGVLALHAGEALQGWEGGPQLELVCLRQSKRNAMGHTRGLRGAHEGATLNPIREGHSRTCDMHMRHVWGSAWA